MVDRDLLLRKLVDLEEYLRQVSEYRGISVDQYRSDWKTQRVVERRPRPVQDNGAAMDLGLPSSPA